MSLVLNKNNFKYIDLTVYNAFPELATAEIIRIFNSNEWRLNSEIKVKDIEGDYKLEIDGEYFEKLLNANAINIISETVAANDEEDGLPSLKTINFLFFDVSEKSDYNN